MAADYVREDDGDDGADLPVCPLAEEAGQRLVVASERNTIPFAEQVHQITIDRLRGKRREVSGDPACNESAVVLAGLPPLDAMNESVREGVRQRAAAKEERRLQSQKQAEQASGYANDLLWGQGQVMKGVELLQSVGLVPKFSIPVSKMVMEYCNGRCWDQAERLEREAQGWLKYGVNPEQLEIRIIDGDHHVALKSLANDEEEIEGIALRHGPVVPMWPTKYQWGRATWLQGCVDAGVVDGRSLP